MYLELREFTAHVAKYSRIVKSVTVNPGGTQVYMHEYAARQ
jgi:hypothetical protein